MKIELYRHNDRAAINIEGMGTIYISPNEAETMGLTLQQIAGDVETVPFAKSMYATRHFEGESK